MFVSIQKTVVSIYLSVEWKWYYKKADIHDVGLKIFANIHLHKF